MNGEIQSQSLIERLKDNFDTMVVYKDLDKNNFISAFKLPSYMRDFVLKKFQDEDGSVDTEEAIRFIQTFIPRKEEWKAVQNQMINYGETVRMLARMSIDLNIATGETRFELPDYGLFKGDTLISTPVWESCADALLKSEESWGVVKLGYRPPSQEGSRGKKNSGKIELLDFKEFCPYSIDLEEYKDARAAFSLDEWIDIVLGAVDYRADGYGSIETKLAVCKRLLPFFEKRINLMELAPPGTGKSYLFGQINRYGWLVSGKVSRSKLIYDRVARKDGIVATHDFVALDEIREAAYMRDEEIQAALQAIMENGKYRSDNGHEVNVDAGIIFLGNIHSRAMDVYANMFQELPRPFHQAQFIDRIHGFISGWELPRMNDDLKAHGWALNSEYFSSVAHLLREDPSYRVVVDELVEVPPKSDTRDTEAVKRVCTAYLKLLFPNVRTASDVKPREFMKYCLRPAIKMRKIIWRQLSILDAEYKNEDKLMPEFTLKEINDEI